MFPHFHLLNTRVRMAATAAAALLALALSLSAWAQSSTQESTPPQAPSAGQQQKPQQQVPEAGGPQGDVGPIVLPKKKEEAPPPPPPKPKAPEGMPSYTITKDVGVVSVPVLVTTKDGQFIPGLKADNFKVFEDGVPQKISNFNQAEAPITAVLLVEFANNNYFYQFMYDAVRASYTFASTLKKDDWVAVVEFDMKPTILVDFTQDKNSIYAALNQLRIPGFSEVNVFDALYDTLDRVSRIEGRKYIILISSGCDTFSKITYDKLLKKIKDTPDVGVFTISTGEALRVYLEGAGVGNGMGGLMPCAQMGYSNMDFLQADNQMATYARMTGGRWYHPRFEGEFPEIFHDIGAAIRNEYVLAYHPTNPKLDGTYRKLKVQVVGPDGSPLKVKDQKGKDVKYSIIAREGYTAKHEVE